ncbi:hypothetical protein HDU91_002417, partial [Kappamyces sp. JEL0680]
IQSLESRVEDLKVQNGLLHSQFEQLSLSKLQFAGEPEDIPAEGAEGQVSAKTVTDLGEVIKFLRREKEIVDTKLQISLQENERARLQLEHLQKSLDESREVLDEERKKTQDYLGSERKHKELLEKIEQTHLLRESNITLRSQLETSQKKIGELDQKLKATEIQIEPLKQQVSQLESEVEARKAEGRALLEDNARWKGRAQQILEKYERIDPVEHESLKASVVALTAETEDLKTQMAAARASVEASIAGKESQIKTLQAEIVSLKQTHEKAIQERENELVGLRDLSTNQEVVALQEKLALSSAKNKSLAKEANEKLKARIATIKELNEQIEILKNEKSDLEMQLNLTIQSTEQRLAKEKQAELGRITASWEAKYGLLQQTLEDVKATATAADQLAPNAAAPAETPLEETPSKRGRESDSFTHAEPSQPPSAKRIRVEEPAAPEMESAADVADAAADSIPEPEELRDEESAELLDHDEAQQEDEVLEEEE